MEKIFANRPVNNRHLITSVNFSKYHDEVEYFVFKYLESIENVDAKPYTYSSRIKVNLLSYLPLQSAE